MRAGLGWPGGSGQNRPCHHWKHDLSSNREPRAPTSNFWVKLGEPPPIDFE